MATILTKKSDTSSSVPLAADLTNAAGGAELAVNTADKRLYSKTSGGSVVELGTNPSALSLPNGTANGVPYLNGSKVLTSGSALTFDGTGLGIGTGTIPAGRKLVIDSGNIRLSNDYQIEWGGSTVGLYGNGSTNSLSFFANTSEQMRLTSTGLLVGTTSQIDSGSLCLQKSGAASNGIVIKDTNTGGGNQLKFLNSSGTTVGYINQNGTVTVYSTTSDQRLKTVLGAITDSGTRIDALEPIEYEWKSDGSRTRGFLAHKFQEVYAGSVTGTKDAVDAEGKPVYQAMQAGSSEVIADLVAEIQSLRKRLAALESK